MRTTVDIPDETYRDLKIKAAREGKRVRQIVLRGIQRELDGAEEEPVRKLQLPLIQSARSCATQTDQETVDDVIGFP
jgi:plasmid stability protein